MATASVHAPTYSYGASQSPDVIVAGGLDGRVYAVNAWTGEVLWSFDSGGPMVDSSQCLVQAPKEMPPTYRSASARREEEDIAQVDVDGSVGMASEKEAEQRSVIQQKTVSTQAMTASATFMSQFVPSYDGRLYHFSTSKVKELSMTMADIVNENGPVRLAVDPTAPSADGNAADILLFGEKKLEMFALDAVSGFRRPYSSVVPTALSSEILFGRSEFTTRAVHSRNASSARCFKISEFFMDFAQQAHCSVVDGSTVAPEILVLPKDPNSVLEDEGSTIVAYDPWTSEQLWEFEIPNFEVLAVYGVSTTRGATFYQWKVDGPSSTATNRPIAPAQITSNRLHRRVDVRDQHNAALDKDQESGGHKEQETLETAKELVSVVPHTWDAMESRFRLRLVGDNYFLESNEDGSAVEHNPDGPSRVSPSFHGRHKDGMDNMHEDIDSRFELADSDDDIFLEDEESVTTMNGEKSISSSGESDTAGSCCSNSNSSSHAMSKSYRSASLRSIDHENATTDAKSSEDKSSAQESSDASSSESGDNSATEVEVLFPFVCQSRFVNEFEEISAIDLKPANIFVADTERDEIKLGDFGLSRYAANVNNLNASSSLDDSQQPPVSSGLKESPLSTSMWSNMSESNEVTAGVGTYLYASPEQVAGKKYNAKTDIYSLGMILFELCHERFGTTMERYVTLRDARDSKFPPDLRAAKRCPEILDMLRKLLSHDPTTRPTANEVVQWGQMMYETSLAQKALDVVRSPRNLGIVRTAGGAFPFVPGIEHLMTSSPAAASVAVLTSMFSLKVEAVMEHSSGDEGGERRLPNHNLLKQVCDVIAGVSDGKVEIKKCGLHMESEGVTILEFELDPQAALADAPGSDIEGFVVTAIEALAGVQIVRRVNMVG
ncbi:hypothetical protein BBP00_00002932 [Phytophthora kernoviae]|uniref:non-specific serine/threonine protein kinase n=1 Tax=Phytophthora kernoviae TaxID=325452 RepID=A0A3F2RW08_9STRA|nr:hypothetical protein BBP00_00002932 [Phytophthora kernoviae]